MKPKKSIFLRELTYYLDHLLRLSDWKDDPSNNGLQWEGNEMVSKAAFAVDASQETFQMAVEQGAEILFVHHGISWGGGTKRFTGLMGKRLEYLANHRLSLYAVHLPLDANPEFGHNVCLCRMIGLENLVPFGTYHGKKIGFFGILPTPKTVKTISAELHAALKCTHDPRFMGNVLKKCRKIGVISGGGAWPELFEECLDDGIQCLITGEATHESFHPAKEAGTAVVSLGHYHTETVGVRSVMELVEDKFGIDTIWIDYPTKY